MYGIELVVMKRSEVQDDERELDHTSGPLFLGESWV
jgi:hypothetical protein